MKSVLLFFAVACAVIPVSCLTTLQPLVTAVNIVQDNRIRGHWQSDKGAIEIASMQDTKMFDLNDSSSMSWAPSKITRRDSALHVKLFDVFMNDKGVKQFMKSTIAVDGKSVDGKIEKNDNKSDSVVFSKRYSVIFKHNNYRHIMMGSLTRIGNNLFIELEPEAINDKMVDGTGLEYGFDYAPSYSIGKVKFDNNQLSIQFLNGDYIKELINTGRVRIKHEKDELFGSFLITASSDELKQFLEKYGDDDRLYSKNGSLTLTRKG